MVFLGAQPVIASVVINQFMPNPQDERTEWIELQNTDSQQIDISGYQLDDEPNAGSKPYLIPTGTTIGSNGTLRFSKDQTNIALNNSKQKDQSFADQVRLLDKTGTQIDNITYIDTKTDVPIGHVTPTPQPTITPSSIPASATPTLKPSPHLVSSPTETPSNVKPIEDTLAPTQIHTVLAATTEAIQTERKSSSASKKSYIGQILIVIGVFVTVVSLALTRYTNKQ